MGNEDNKQPIAYAAVTEGTLISKAIFAFFGHTKDYERLRDDEKKTIAHFRPMLKRAAQHTHSCIVSDNYNTERHKWIKPKDDPEEHDIPMKFTGIGSQLSKEKPVFASRTAKVFPKSFAAICIVAGDVLAGHYNNENGSSAQLREICMLSENGTISDDQNAALGMITKTLRKFAAETTPDWAITYEKNRPIIRTDKTNYFAHNNTVQAAMAKVAGKYLCYRKAFTPANNEQVFLREYLTIAKHPSGPIFHWRTCIGATKEHRTFHGVVTFPKNAVWLIGHNDYPMQRIRVASLSLREFQEYREDGNQKKYVRGTVLSNAPHEIDAEPIGRDFVLKADFKGQTTGEEYERRAKFMTTEQVRQALSDEEFQIIL